MSKPRIILATNRAGLIGVDGTLPWSRPADLKRFKAQTMGGVLIMGRLTYESIGRPLPGRQTFVLTSKPDAAWKGVQVFHDLKSALQAAGSEETWIAGGASVYAEALPLCDELDVTIVADSVQVPKGEREVYLSFFKDGQIEGFRVAGEATNGDDRALLHRRYVRKGVVLSNLSMSSST